MNEELYAKEAQRLLLDDAFAEAFARVRRDTLEALVEATGDDVVRLQERVKALDSIPAELERAIVAKSDAPNGFDPNQRPDPPTAVN